MKKKKSNTNRKNLIFDFCKAKFIKKKKDKKKD